MFCSYRVCLVYLREAIVTTMILRVVMSEKVLYITSPGGLEKVLYVASPGDLMCNKYGFRVTLWYVRGC